MCPRISDVRAKRDEEPSILWKTSGNVPVRYPSRKMGVIIQAESRTVEFAGVYLMEHDPAVLEFWDQPPPITLHYQVQQKNGRTRTIGVLHTPDYFVIREHALGWEE